MNSKADGAQSMEINRRDFVKAGACAALAGAPARAEEMRYQVGAFYFPNWHVDPHATSWCTERDGRNGKS